MNDLPESSLLLHSLGRCLLISGVGIAAVAAGYAAAGRIASRYRRRLPAGAETSQWLATSAVPTGLAEAWCRATGLAVVAIVVAAGAPWVHTFVGDLVNGWDGSRGGSQPWHYGLLALVVWIGFLPFALFVWRLPRWTVDWPPPVPARGAAHATIRSIGGPDGRPNAEPLAGTPPHSDPVRRSCRRYASAVALGASDRLEDPKAGAYRWPPIEVVLLIPAVVALLLATTINAWIVVAVIVVVVTWGWLVYTATYRAAVAAPGTALADYLLLSRGAAGNGADRTRRLAETYIERNPATFQDHEQLMAVLSRAAQIGPVPWNPHSVGASQVEVKTQLWTTDRRGQDREISLTCNLRRQPGRDWHIVRIALDDPDGGRAPVRRPRFGVASASIPR